MDTFLHEGNTQIIKGATFIDTIINGVHVLSGGTVPTTLSAPSGSIYICLLEGSVGLYQNTGTELLPVWRKLEVSV